MPTERDPLIRTASPGPGGGVCGGARADADDEVPPRLAGVGADLAVEPGLALAELAHHPEHGDRARRPEAREMVERRAHRHRVGVVTVVHEDDPIGELDPFAAEPREAYVD